MGSRFGAGGRNLAGAASRQSDRTDAIGLGGGLFVRGAASCARPAALGMARAIFRRLAARARDAVDPPQYSRTHALGAALAQFSGRSGLALPAPTGAPRVAARRDVLLPALRILGHVHVAARVSCDSDRARRRRAQRTPLLGLDCAAAGRRIFRLSLLRISGRPHRPPRCVPHLCADDGGPGAGLRTCRSPRHFAVSAGSADRFLRPRLLQRARRAGGGASSHPQIRVPRRRWLWLL